jgi:hypothetical protein
MKCSVYVGYDPHEKAAFDVCQHSLRRHMRQPLPINRVSLTDLIHRGLYKRPTSWKPNGGLIDRLSMRDDYDGSMSTEHAIARFFVPLLEQGGWALFMDGDTLVRDDINKIFEGLDERKMLYCVQHDYWPRDTVKKVGQKQTQYQRKNWSSVMIFNCEWWRDWRQYDVADYFDIINMLPGRDLHRFCFVKDHEIGALDPRWNWLVGHSDPRIDPAIVHFTEGLPDVPGYENVAFADEWRAELQLEMAAQ